MSAIAEPPVLPDLPFHPAVVEWFRRTFGTPTEPQRLGWPAIHSGGDTLIAAPTGSGKTLAAFLASLDRLFREGIDGTLRDELSIVYVSPLKALSNDIHKNLDEPLAGIRSALREASGHDIEVRAEVRTGDTSPSRRQAIARRPPHILVTTPESLYLLLTSDSGRRTLRTARTILIDEIHALVANRRGSHLALSLERLAALTGRPLQRIGLSATQKPIEEVARFLVGARRLDSSGNARCRVVDCGYSRDLDLAIELPPSPLEAVMSNETWSEVYNRLAELIQAHRTTLVFVNTRRLAERLSHQLAHRLGQDQVMSHHGSLSAKLRLEAEHRLKRGELRALVATASLELGIDIGSVDLVCQVGPARSIARLLQRVGRAEHRRGGRPKGRIFPLSRDELVETLATVRSVARGELDRLHIPPSPLDVLSQQIVAAASCEDWDETALFELVRSAYPYRGLPRHGFDEVVRMLSEGFTTRRGRRGALLHHDAVNHRIRGRRGARLVALTSGGAIPDNSDYRVVLEPTETFIGTINEDFAVESQAGDIFQLGNASWRILRVNSGTVRVEDARGQPPGIPFWLGEAPGRSDELSRAVSELRQDAEERLAGETACPPRPHPAEAVADLAAWLEKETGLSAAGAAQIAEYFTAAHRSLGVLPSQSTLVLERFFDESGGMQLVLHSPFGIRVNRAWGLALRKRFCRTFNFELQAAATDDAIVLSLGTQHSFPLEEVFRYLSRKTVRDLLIQALLDAPMFPIRWRWNATRALALPRQRGGRRIAAPLQRMESENLLASVFPDQLACPENLTGDREVPDHPLVRQTIDDCLNEAMDIEGLLAVLRGIEEGAIRVLARDLPEPSPLAHEILNAKPYAFLDNAPIEERRTQAVHLRRAADFSEEGGLGLLDPAAIEKVCAEAWPQPANPDEVHEALLLAGVLTDSEMVRLGTAADRAALIRDRRAGQLPNAFWIAAERLPLIEEVYGVVPPDLVAPIAPPPPSVPGARHRPDRAESLRELVRGRLEIAGPVTVPELAATLALPASEIESALLALESEGFVLRGHFRHRNADRPVPLEWCDRRLLARIHRLTLHRLRAEIQPVSIAEFQRYLLAWQKADEEHRAEGPEGLAAVLELLDGYELAAGSWEPDVLALRVRGYRPSWLDQLCFTGRIGWGRLIKPELPRGGDAPVASNGPIRSSPISIFTRESLPDWLALAAIDGAVPPTFSAETTLVWNTLKTGGALFFGELARRTGLLPTRVEQALAELAAAGLVTADSFEGLRALLLPEKKRAGFGPTVGARRHRAITSIEFAGRWTSLHRGPLEPLPAREPAIERFARVLLRRYGVVFRRMIERESMPVSWFDLIRTYRRWEARGEIRGGYFVGGVSGEQFALPEAIGLLRSIRKAPAKGERIVISAADPLNFSGILTPGPRIPAIGAHRILLRDGRPIAALRAGEIVPLDPEPAEPRASIENALRVGKLAPELRPYYA